MNPCTCAVLKSTCSTLDSEQLKGQEKEMLEFALVCAKVAWKTMTVPAN